MENALLLDSLFDGFCRTLPEPLALQAKGLAHHLGLAPSRDIPWSEIFTHKVTLTAPALFAQTMTQVPINMVNTAVFVHMLAVIDAFCIDRIHDGQITTNQPMDALLQAIRKAYKQSITTLAPTIQDPSIDLDFARNDTLEAMGIEQKLLQSNTPVDLLTYETVSLSKQRLAFPASIALAHAAGWANRKRKTVETTLASLFLGLQIHDDVVDWEDDWIRSGGAWAFALALGSSSNTPHTLSTPCSLQTARNQICQSGMLAIMLKRASNHFQAAAQRARALSALHLSDWALSQATRTAELAKAERTSAGYTLRERALHAWASETLL